MTAEDIREEEAPESGVASDPDEQNTNAKRDSAIEEGESDLRSSNVDISLANPAAQLVERIEEEGEARGAQDGGAIEQHGTGDPYGDGEESKEGDEYCPFCMYMKSGACGELFANWEECINEGEKAGEDVVEKCVRVTRLLTQCMRANADYYGPVLEAEKAMASATDGLDDASKEKAESTDREAVEIRAHNAAREAEG